MGGWIVDMIQLPFRNHKHACFVNIQTDHDHWHSCLAPSDETTDVDYDPIWRWQGELQQRQMLSNDFRKTSQKIKKICRTTNFRSSDQTPAAKRPADLKISAPNRTARENFNFRKREKKLGDEQKQLVIFRERSNTCIRHSVSDFWCSNTHSSYKSI